MNDNDMLLLLIKNNAKLIEKQQKEIELLSERIDNMNEYLLLVTNALICMNKQ